MERRHARGKSPAATAQPTRHRQSRRTVLVEVELEAFDLRAREHRVALGRHVRSVRGPLSQAALAGSAEIGLSTLKRIEAGDPANVVMYERIGAVLDLPWGWWGLVDAWFTTDRAGDSNVALEQALAAVGASGLRDREGLGYVRELLEIGTTREGTRLRRTHVRIARDHLRAARALAARPTGI